MDRLIKFTRANWVVIFAFLIGFFVLLPLFQPGFFSMHDNEQIGRLYDLHQALHDGQFPVRVTSNLGFGYGYVLFNFYPPLVYYVADIFKEVGFSFINSTKIMMGLGFVLSWIFMYLFSREHWGKLGGALSATAYLYAPYHSVDIYVRGAIPEFWSFVFVPAIFWSLKKLKDRRDMKYLIFSGIFGALLVLSHDLIALMAIPFVLIYFLFLLWESRDRLSLMLWAILAGLLSGLLSAFFLVPAVLEKGYTMVNLLTIERASYLQHFVYFRQFVFSKWGYSGSVPGPFDGISFSLGWGHILILAIALLLFIAAILKRNLNNILLFSIFIGLFIFSLFIQTSHSNFIWQKISALSYIQFPWRFLLFSSFSLAFILGSIPYFLKDKNLRTLIVLIAIAVLVVFSKDFFKPEKQFTSKNDPSYIREDYIRWDTSRLAFEYVPAGIKTKKTEFDTTGVAIGKNDIKRDAFKILSGELDVKVLQDKSNYKQLVVNSEDGGVLRLNTFTFPGWTARVDNQKISFSDNNDFKLITLKIPSGEHQIELKFENTPVRRVSNLLTAVGFFLLAVLAIASFKKAKIAKI